MGSRSELYSVCFVCSGNICRSPIAEIVFRHQVHEAGLGHAIAVDSAGTGEWHVGEPADRRAVEVLQRSGYDGRRHRARQFARTWFAERDLVIALDRGHQRTLRAWAPTPADQEKVQLLRCFDPALPPGADGAELDVPDPYYAQDEAFDHVLSLVTAACHGLLDAVRSELAA